MVAADQDGILVVEEVPVPSYLIQITQLEHIQYQYLFKLVLGGEDQLNLPIHSHPQLQHMEQMEHHHILEHH